MNVHLVIVDSVAIYNFFLLDLESNKIEGNRNCDKDNYGLGEDFSQAFIREKFSFLANNISVVAKSIFDVCCLVDWI